MIGYTRQPDARVQRVKEVNSMCEEYAWSFPTDVEDLIVLGHGQMSAQEDFTFFLRPAGGQSWCGVPALEE